MQIVKLWNIVVFKKGKKPKSFVNFSKEGYSPYILIEQMEWHPVKQYTNDACPQATKDDILIVRDWSIWKTATNIEWAIWSTIVAITPLKINKDYLHYFIKYSKPTILANPKWSGLAHINPDVFWNLQIPLYSLPQQQAIVDEIKKQLSRLDNWLQSLENIKDELKSYKASVLKSAVEGKLTEQRRKENKNIEPASKLLEIILEERKYKRIQEHPWKKYVGPKEKLTTEELAILYDLPNDRIRTKLDAVCFMNRWKSKHRPRNDAKLFGWKYPFIQTGEITNSNWLVSEYTKTLSEFWIKQSKLRPKWTLCITIAANIAFTGFLWFDSCFPDSVVWIETLNDTMDIHYINLFIKAVRERIEKFAPATAQRNINLNILSDINIPLPPIKEQQQIVQDVEEKISVVDNVLNTIEANIKRAKQLKQSILHQAFTGQLVPMKDDEKGATELLAEIEKTKAMLVWQKKTKKVKQK